MSEGRGVDHVCGIPGGHDAREPSLIGVAGIFSVFDKKVGRHAIIKFCPIFEGNLFTDFEDRDNICHLAVCDNCCRFAGSDFCL